MCESVRASFWIFPVMPSVLSQLSPSHLTLRSVLGNLALLHLAEEFSAGFLRTDLFCTWGIADSMDMSLSKLREMVKDREAWPTAVPGVTKDQT